jgi:hypothetical protein
MQPDAAHRGRPNSVEPHLGQKVRSTICPLAPGLLNVTVVPVILTAASGMATIVACSPPVSF